MLIRRSTAVLAACDLSQVLLPDPAAVLTLSLKEHALALTGPLLRLPYFEHLLGWCAKALTPALARAHGDLAVHLAELIVSLFDADQLRVCKRALARQATRASLAR